MQKNKRFKFLQAAVLCACCGSAVFGGAAEAHEGVGEFYLPGVTVEATRYVLPGGMVATRGDVGLLGNKNVMEVPYSQTNISEEAFKVFGGLNQPIDNVLVNIPSVRQTGTMLHGDFSVRGKSTNGYFFYLNGVPAMFGQFITPNYVAETVQVTEGPNKAISGSFPAGEGTGVAAVINMQTKRATKEPVTRFKQSFSGKSGLGESIDIGRRFGENDEWGVRVNAEITDGNPTHYKATKRSRGIFANIDHIDEKSSTNLFGGYYWYQMKDGMRWFGFDKKSMKEGKLTHLPDAPDSKNNFSFPGQNKVMEATVFVLNHEQKINDSSKVFFNAGWQRGNLRKNITGQGSRLWISDDDGTYLGKYFSRRTPSHKYYTQLGANTKFDTGDIEHDLTLAVDKSWSKTFTGVEGGYGQTTFWGKGGNLYTGVDPDEEVTIPKFKNYNRSSAYSKGVSIMDTMKTGKAEVLVGIHRHETKKISKGDPTAAKVTRNAVKSDANCPAFGIVYRPNDNVSLYASHSEFFDSGKEVGAGYENEGDVLSPNKAKSNEIGVKYLSKGFLATVAAFENKEANYITVFDKDDADKKWLTDDGRNTYKGIEVSFNGKIAEKWNALGGFMYLDAERTKTQKGTYDGFVVGGIPRWNAVAALQYSPDKDWAITGRAVYVDKTPIFPAGNAEKWDVPSYVTYDLGVSYKSKINDIPVKYQAMCYNVSGKDYWIAYGSGVHLSRPRTFMFSTEFDF